jgi:hypothetical protein
MTDPNKAKGDKAEREAADLLTTLLARPVRRLLGAGRADDVGDLTGVKGWALQVAWWPANTLRAIRVKPLDAATQAANSGTPHSAALIRMVGGQWRVVMTLDQWADVVRSLEGGVPCLTPEEGGPVLSTQGGVPHGGAYRGGSTGGAYGGGTP